MMKAEYLYQQILCHSAIVWSFFYVQKRIFFYARKNVHLLRSRRLQILIHLHLCMYVYINYSVTQNRTGPALNFSDKFGDCFFL